MKILILRNTIYNGIGLVLPAVVALFTIPPLVRGLGNEVFGYLTLVWAIVSYFGLFDFGLGRAVTQQTSVLIARGQQQDIASMFHTSLIILSIFGLIAGILMLVVGYAGYYWIDDIGRKDDFFWSLVWMSIAMPFIVLTSAYRGLLEGAGHFGSANLIRLPMGIFTFVGPLICLWIAGPDLITISAVLVVGRIVSLILHVVMAKNLLNTVGGEAVFKQKHLATLLGMGGWMTVSGVISPLMNYLDRFLIGAVISAAAVTIYTTPQELVLRFGLIPSAMSGVLFAEFSRYTNESFQFLSRKILTFSSIYLALLLPISIVTYLFSYQILELWISASFAKDANAILAVMAGAILVNGLAQIPYTMLQAQGFSKLTGVIHAAEFPVYAGLLYIAVTQYGLMGAAIVWLARIIIDYLVLLVANFTVLKNESL